MEEKNSISYIIRNKGQRGLQIMHPKLLVLCTYIYLALSFQFIRIKDKLVQDWVRVNMT
jgi:hypothetical protein